MLIGLDLDGVLCDLGPTLAARIAEKFDVTTHPSAWRTYDLRRLRLGLPEGRYQAFLDEAFHDPTLYEKAAVVSGAASGMAQLRSAGWRLVGITARPPHLTAITTRWLAAQGLSLESVHHTIVNQKSTVAHQLGVQVTVEDNPEEAELLGEVCQSWLFDRPYNRDHTPVLAKRVHSWDELVGRLCQLRLFA
ncbi:MAG TPA: hypothetical protein VM121_09870 [Acidimicrobiales bacterium]|nr:hypothetical protein [Acidimicrobiales bacterium]